MIIQREREIKRQRSRVIQNYKEVSRKLSRPTKCYKEVSRELRRSTETILANMEGFKTKLLAMEQLVRRVEDFTAITKN